MILIKLTDSQTSEHLWSDTYDRDLKDVFAIQSDVAQRVAGALQVQLMASVKKRIEKEPTKSQEAHSLYLKGLQHFNEYTEEGFGKALQYFSLAVLADPNYAQPYVLTYASYFLQAIFGYVRFDEVMDKAYAAAFKAIELDKDSADAHILIAGIKFNDLDYAGAEAESRRSVELDPSYAGGHFQHAIHLRVLGRREEALMETRKFAGLDPLSPRTNTELGWMLCQNGLFDEAINQLKKTIEMDPYFHASHMTLGCTYLAASRFDEAISELQLAIKLTGGKDLRYVGYLGEAYARSGKEEEARKIIETFENISGERPVADAIAMVYLALGELDKTFLWAEKAIEEHNPAFLGGLNTEWEWNSVRSDPRFVALLRKAGHKVD